MRQSRHGNGCLSPEQAMVETTVIVRRGEGASQPAKRAATQVSTRRLTRPRPACTPGTVPGSDLR